jgi:integrase
MGSRNSAGRRKRAKPHPDFPLFKHATGRWCKKVRRKFHYFGYIADDPSGQAALDEWLRVKDDLLAGRVPRPKDEKAPTIRDLLNRFLDGKELASDNGEVTRRTFVELRDRTAKRIARVIGLAQPIAGVTTADFERLRADLKGLALSTQTLEIQRIRSVFNFAYQQGVIDRPVRFGSFKAPGAKVLRRARQKNRQGGLKMFEAAEIRALLDHSRPRMRAMILLAANAGYGNSDIGTLRWSAVDLEGGWVTHPRPKTGAERRCPLWRETIEALKEIRDKRPVPKDASYADRVFLTQNGEPFVRLVGDDWHDTIGPVFYKVMQRAEVQRAGRAFYALRHGAATIAGETGDQVATDFIMGHLRDDMASVYRERIDDRRLRRVVEHVHVWLFGKSDAKC